MKKNKIFSLLGLATRSRNVVSGEFMTEKAVKSYSAELVIVGEDASDNTKKKFQKLKVNAIYWANIENKYKEHVLSNLTPKDDFKELSAKLDFNTPKNKNMKKKMKGKTI